MTSEGSCSVTMSDPRVMSQYRNFVIMLSGASAGVPNLSLTLYPFSIPTDEHAPFQHFDRCKCTPKTSYDNTFYHDYSLIYLTISI